MNQEPTEKKIADFIECDTCRAKPGMPILCNGCLHNRNLIEDLKAMLSLSPKTEKASWPVCPECQFELRPDAPLYGGHQKDCSKAESKTGKCCEKCERVATMTIGKGKGTFMAHACSNPRCDCHNPESKTSDEVVESKRRILELAFPAGKWNKDEIAKEIDALVARVKKDEMKTWWDSQWEAGLIRRKKEGALEVLRDLEGMIPNLIIPIPKNQPLAHTQGRNYANNEVRILIASLRASIEEK